MRDKGTIQIRGSRPDLSVLLFLCSLSVLWVTAGWVIPAHGGMCPTAREQEVIDLINDERVSKSLSPLAMDWRLVEAARLHSQDMATNDFFSHTGSGGAEFWQRIEMAGYDWLRASENIAAGYATARSVVDAWMASPGHKANILDSAVREIGVGYAYGEASTYGNYWTADFGTADGGPVDGGCGLTPTIGCSPMTLSFTATQGGGNPVSKSLAISNTGGGTLTWSVSDNATWLSLAPVTGTNGGTVTVSANNAGLSAGTYRGTITVSASGATNSPVMIPVTLTVNAPPPNGSISINNVSRYEGSTGTTAFIFTVTLSPAGTGTVTVNYATANGTAAAGSDYTATSGTLTFSPGQTTKTVNVNVAGDTAIEPNEAFYINLSNATGATIFDGRGQGTITNDD